MNYYVYYSYEVGVDNPRGYIGRRQCLCSPEKDINYFGSFTDETFNPTEKIIIKTCETVEEAIRSEIHLHWLFNVDKSFHFANKSKQTSTKFHRDMTGVPRSEVTKQKISQGHRGKTQSEETKRKISMSLKGRRRVEVISDETRRRMSESKKGIPLSEETKRKISESSKGKAMSTETRQKISRGKIGKVWYVNSEGKTVKAFEPPSDEWQKGRKWKATGKTD